MIPTRVRIKSVNQKQVTAKMRYEIIGITKYAEEDSFERGCLPDTTACDTTVCFDIGRLGVQGESQKEAIEELIHHFGAFGATIEDCIEIDEDQVSLAVMENSDGHYASESELEEWKEGKTRLWYCTYIGSMVSVQPSLIEAAIT